MFLGAGWRLDPFVGVAFVLPVADWGFPSGLDPFIGIAFLLLGQGQGLMAT